MIRKMLVVAAAAAMPITAVAATGGFASAAAPPPVNATNYTVACTGISATAKFSPALTTLGGPASNEATSIKGSATGCTVTPTLGGTPVSVTSVKISGTINNAGSTHTCGGLTTATSETGSLTAKWKTTPKLTAASSVVNPNSVLGGVGGDGHATFALSFGAATSGPFQGTDGGITSSNSAETVLPVAGPTGILALCGGKGIKSLAITTNTNLGAPPAALALK